MTFEGHLSRIEEALSKKIIKNESILSGFRRYKPHFCAFSFCEVSVQKWFVFVNFVLLF